MTLFSYCIPIDDGAAPNPFWGTCTLAICKPVIRRVAEVGDWIVGTGSKKFGFDNHVVYAIRVTQVLTFEEYDKYCKTLLPDKIPDWNSPQLKRRVGDCIYDYSNSSGPVQREGVHNGDNIVTDLGGRNVLLSNEFYYFGSEPIPLPGNLVNIVKQGQGHRSKSNDKYAHDFISWIATFEDCKNKVNADPYGLKDYEYENCRSKCSNSRREYNEEDEKLGHTDC